MYRLTANPNVVQRVADGAWVPKDPRNGDWRAYLAWVEAGNKPTAAPPPPPPPRDRVAEVTGRLAQIEARLTALEARGATPKP